MAYRFLMRTAIIASFTTLSACKAQKPFIWKDYCVQQKRKIPPAERYRDVLINLLENRTKYSVRFANEGGVHFFTYLDRYRHKNPKATDGEVATQYVREYPECCLIYLPAYYRENWRNERYADGISGGNWVADVYIWRQLPPVDSKILDRFARAVDTCGKSIGYVGGMNGILE